MKKFFDTEAECNREITRRRSLLQTIPINTIPAELRALPQWICWRYEVGEQKNGTFRVNKTPYVATAAHKHAKTDAQETWRDFDTAFQCFVNDSFFDGIGFVFSENDPYTGIDFDNCRDPETGDIHPTVTDWCKQLNGYAEPSVSGTGGHVIVKGKLPNTFKTGFKFTKYPEDNMDIEVYDKKRYFIVTGNANSKVKEIPDAQPALDKLIIDYQNAKGKKKQKSTARPTTQKSDADIIETLKGGKQANKFNALWQGRWEPLYNSQSEADLALCNIIAFHANDKTQVDSLFRQSALYREKWERKDYRTETLNKAWDTAQTARTETPKRENSPYFIKSKFIPTAMMDAIDAEFHIIAFPNEKQVRIYRDGIYRLDTDSYLQREIHKRLGIHAKQSHVIETLTMLRDRHMQALPADGDMPSAHPGHLNLKNGILQIDTGDFYEHTPTFKSLIQMPVLYDPNATCPAIDTFLSDILQANTDDIKLAHEIMGYAALQQLPIPAIVVLLGPTHTGKSTFLDLLTQFLGIENVSGISLQALDDENIRFARARLYGKLANLSADLSKKTLAGDSNIKKIAAGDRFDVERKGVDAFLMRPFATLICATNDMPKSRDKSDAWLERLLILPFVRQHTGEKAIRNYLDKLTTPAELSGLLNHAIAGIKRIMNTGTFTKTKSTTAAGEAYRLSNNSVARFLEETYIFDSGSFVLEDTSYKAYQNWCEAEGLGTPATKTQYRKDFQTAGIKRARKNKDGKRFFVWEDIRHQIDTEKTRETGENDELMDRIPL